MIPDVPTSTGEEVLKAREVLVQSRDKLCAERKVMVDELIARINALKWLRNHKYFVEDNLLVPVSQISGSITGDLEKNITQEMFKFVKGVENTLELKSYQNFSSIQEATRCIDQSNEKFIKCFNNVIEVSREIAKAKQITEPNRKSYIIPCREDLVYDFIFKCIEKHVNLDEKAKDYIVLWCRYTIASSLASQQKDSKIEIFIYKGDKSAREIASKYLPAFPIAEVTQGDLLKNIQDNPASIALVDTEQKLNKTRLKTSIDPKLYQNISILTPLSRVSDISTNIKEIAYIAEKDLIDVDRREQQSLKKTLLVEPSMSTEASMVKSSYN